MDCYCEQKIFEKYDRIYELAEKLKNDIKSFNKKILKKYGVRIIILGLLPFLGFVFNILFAGGRNNALINLCNKTKHVTEPNHDDCKAFYTKIDQETFNNIGISNYAFFFIVVMGNIANCMTKDFCPVSVYIYNSLYTLNVYKFSSKYIFAIVK
ncbi:Plasmodium exported protein, unknown function [Plasmodium vivax]|uniref:Uncharacterized protein n=1 Tax=Plasmodium vivax TaxID=5855 RepID=A0A565A753_PLAVI|nr:Plasmodium exported protein, unknown function [Plasmodium vivax]